MRRKDKNLLNLVKKKKKGGAVPSYVTGGNARHRADRKATGGVTPAPADGAVKQTFARGGHLSAAGRRALPSSDFALPGKGKGPEGKGSGSYPIPDEGHAKSALSRGAANASPAEQATIKRKVKAKFPSMDVS